MLKNLAKRIVHPLIPQSVYRARRRREREKWLMSAEEARFNLGKANERWRQRIDDAVAAPDNAFIARVPEAGQLKDYYIVMHNGVKVCAMGYYEAGNMNLLVENRGVHEPQEERAFEEVLRHLPERCTMIELGAYWGFYSLSLLERKPGSRCYLVEPDPDNLLSGQVNFRLNKRKGTFVNAFVGASPKSDPPTVSVDSLMADKKLKRVDILHADIQGAELEMLFGAERCFTHHAADFVFISTHSNELHAACLEKLRHYGYVILADADLDETYSYDGLIVAKSSEAKGPDTIAITQKPS